MNKKTWSGNKMKWKRNQKNMNVPLKNIKPNIKNPRKGQYDRIDLDELKESLESLGQITNLIIDENGNLLAGHRRHQAAKELKWSTMKCDVLIGLSTFRKSAIMISDNATQKQFNAWESRSSINDIYWNEFTEEYHFKGTNDKGYGEFAKQLGISRTQVKRIIDSMSKMNQAIGLTLKKAGCSADIFDTILQTPDKHRKKMVKKALELKKKGKDKNSGAGLREHLRMYKKELTVQEATTEMGPGFYSTIHYKLGALGMVLTKNVINAATREERMKLKQSIEKNILPGYKMLKNLK